MSIALLFAVAGLVLYALASGKAANVGLVVLAAAFLQLMMMYGGKMIF